MLTSEVYMFMSKNTNFEKRLEQQAINEIY